MRDNYFFDKREWKRRFLKYGIIFLISFVPIVLFNVYCSDAIGKDWLVVFLDCVFLLVFVAIGGKIADKIFAKKDRRLERLRREREEAEALKQKIMEDSYKRKREEKKSQKMAKDAIDDTNNVSDEQKVKHQNKRTGTSKSSTSAKTKSGSNSKTKTSSAVKRTTSNENNRSN